MKRALLFGGVPVIAGIALIVTWVLANEAASRGTDWTQVVATIETASVRPRAADIAYRYQVRGSAHRNPAGRLTLRDGSAGKAAARLAPGQEILAYVNPQAPGESFLEPRPAPSNVTLLAGTVLVIMGLPLVVFLARQKSQRTPARKPSRPMSRLKPPPSIPRK